ncbi:MAG: DUF1080 domain-containing protein [Akkermansiaceae bacterium]
MNLKRLHLLLLFVSFGHLAAADDPLAGITKGFFNGKRPVDAVQLVGVRGHVLVPESENVNSQWVFQEGVLTASPKWDSLVTPNVYSDFRMHVEFNVNSVPNVDAEKNGNSGIYIQKRYELQILNSHGVSEDDYKASYAGSLYRQKKPDELVSKPAGEWQNYDIVFRAARFENGKRVEKARISVQYNGVLIHDDYAFSNKTGAGQKEGPEPGPIKFQGHHNPVKFRNCWIQRLELDELKKKDAPELKKKKGYTYVIPFDEIPAAPALRPKEALETFRLHKEFEMTLVSYEPAVRNPLTRLDQRAGN